jgi:hypothetical protein
MWDNRNHEQQNDKTHGNKTPKQANQEFKFLTGVNQEEELLRRRVYGTSRKKSKSRTIHDTIGLRQMGAGRKGANDEHDWRNGRRHGVG